MALINRFYQNIKKTMIYKIKDKLDKEWNDKRFVETVLVDDKGEEFKVSFWNGEVKDDMTEIEGELQKNEKGYWKLVTPKKTAGANFKNAQIQQAQEKKNEYILAAQDRSAWMYARKGACEIVANHPSYKNLLPGDIVNTINELATDIYNMEPTKPF